MSPQTFEIQMKRLKQVYGERSYSSERMNLFWNEVKGVSDSAFEKWIDKKILNSIKPPMGEDFQDLARKEKSLKSHVSNIEIKTTYSCNRCRDDGALLAKRKDDGSLWAFVCDCEFGEKSHWAVEKQLPHTKGFNVCRWKYLSYEKKSEYELQV